MPKKYNFYDNKADYLVSLYPALLESQIDPSLIRYGIDEMKHEFEKKSRAVEEFFDEDAGNITLVLIDTTERKILKSIRNLQTGSICFQLKYNNKIKTVWV